MTTRTPGSDQLVFCGSGNSGTKVHVARDVRGLGFGPMCKAQGRNRGSIFAYTQRSVEETMICSKCIKFTRATEEATT